MIVLRYLLIFAGIGLLAIAAAILLWDLFQVLKSRKKVPEISGEVTTHDPLASGMAWSDLRWKHERPLATMSIAPIPAVKSSAVVPSGAAGVRVNEFSGTRPATLYPGVHIAIPLIEQVEVYNVRDNV